MFDIIIENAENNVTYYLIDKATSNVIGTSGTGDGTNLTLNTGALDSDIDILVRGIYEDEPTNCSSDLTDEVSITVSGPSISQSVTSADASICSGSSTTITITSFNDSYTYSLHRKSDDTQIGSSFTGDGAVHDLNTGALNSDETILR